MKTVSSSALGKGSDEKDRGDGSPRGSQISSLVSNDVEATAEFHSFDPPAVCLGTDALSGTDVRWSLTTKGNPHLLIAGLPGMGKTTCLLNICKQMVASNIRPIVFSYHQDIDEKLQDIVSGVRFIDFHGLGFNPLEVLDRESRLAYLDVAGALRDIFIAIYPELGDIQGERIRTAIKQSFLEAGWDEPTATLSERTEPDFKRFVEILRNDPKPDRGLRALLARLFTGSTKICFAEESRIAFTHARRIKCIYIDPPYNTGNEDCGVHPFRETKS